MKYKRTIFIVIYMLAVMVLLSGCGEENKKCSIFQNEEEMSEIVNGIWKTGDTEFDFTLIIENDKANLTMETKDDKESEDIVYVPDKGYFYYLYIDSENNESRKEYSVVNENGEYVIQDDNWTFKKVE